MPTPYPSFDRQAAEYDRRAGLLPEVARAVAAAVAEIAGLRPGDRVIEIGAGTGQIGAGLLAEGARYAGLDLSLGMLAAFRERLRRSPPAAGSTLLLQADGTARWPFRDGSARAIFSSRAIHHLDPDRAAAEMARVAGPTHATVLIGRVRRTKESVRTALRREMRRRLVAAGCAVRDAGGRRERLLAACCGRGAELIETHSVSRWTVKCSARRSLDAWAGKPGLAGTDPPAELKRRVLDELAEWAEHALGGVEREHQCEEVYLLEGARWGARGGEE